MALDVWTTPFAPQYIDRFDQTAAELAAHPRLAPHAALITAEFGIALVRNGRADVARRYLAAQIGGGATLFAHTTSFRCRRLHRLVLLSEAAYEQGRSVLEALRRDAGDEGRVGLVKLIETDLSEKGTAPRTCRPSVVVHVFGPELSVTVNDQRVPSAEGLPSQAARPAGCVQ